MRSPRTLPSRSRRNTAVGLSTSCLAAVVSLSGAQAATAPISLRIPSTTVHGATTLIQDFKGRVTFAPPAGWTRRATAQSGEQLVTAKFTRTLAPGCVATSYVGTASNASHLGPIRQLRSGLPRAAQPGAPTLLPLTYLGTGRVTRGDGGWALATVPAAAQSWVLYGGALIKVASGRYAGLTAGVSAGAGCPATLPQQSAVAATFERLLRATALTGAGLGRLHR